MPKKTLRNKALSRSDNRPLSLKELLDILKELEADPKVDMSKPVGMSSDEEGNDMMVLWSVEVSKIGAVTLWPAHDYKGDAYDRALQALQDGR